MIVSDHHRFVFIEVPRTGSTAVARELVSRYGGRPVLSKHSTDIDFLRAASAEQRGYRRIGGVRHPFDDVVSEFQKLVNNHRGAYDDPGQQVENGGWVKPEKRQQFEFVQGGADFGAFFRRFHAGAVQLQTWDIASRDLDDLLRFESLSTDFERLMTSFGTDGVRPLPTVNATAGRSSIPEAYADPELQRLAVQACGPRARFLGYDIPDDFAVHRVPLASEVAFRRKLRRLANRRRAALAEVARTSGVGL